MWEPGANSEDKIKEVTEMDDANPQTVDLLKALFQKSIHYILSLSY